MRSDVNAELKSAHAGGVTVKRATSRRHVEGALSDQDEELNRRHTDSCLSPDNGVFTMNGEQGMSKENDQNAEAGSEHRVNTTECLALKARFVFPGDAPPIAAGIVTMRGNRIVEVGQRSSISHVHDLGDVAILPGLINVHTHLEFSQLRQPIGSANAPFADWIRQVIRWRRTTMEQGPAEVPYGLAAIHTGLHESLEAGVTCLGDIVTADGLSECFAPFPGNIVTFRELLGLTGDRVTALLDTARRHVAETPSSADNMLRALSPHAPYTTRMSVVERACQLSRQLHFPVAMHLAESQEEVELLAAGRGPLLDLLQELEAWDSDAIGAPTTASHYLTRLSRAHRALVVHGNYLSPDDWDLLARHADHMSVVYCPRTHHYFGHQAYPLARMLQAGVKIAIATDGRSSNPDLCLLSDLREAARRHPQVDPALIFRAGTLTAAEAIGMADELGSLKPGKRADLAIVPLDHGGFGDPWSALFGGHAAARQVICGGRVVCG